jgi:hypothetical protein
LVTNTVTVVPELHPLAALHARELPQKDNLCGPFWIALALLAAGIEEVDGELVDQDLVALRAGTQLPDGDPVTFVPQGARPRNDYRIDIPRAARPEDFGTSAGALVRATEELSAGRLAVVPVSGPWTEDAVLAVVEATSDVPAALLVANIRTGPLWGSRPDAGTLLAHLAGASAEGPPPEWDVGHFTNLVATVRGPGSAFIAVRDTYPTLGWGGYHLQPAERMAAALERGDGKEGGVLAVVRADDAPALRQALERGGSAVRLWDNGTSDGD